MSYPEQAQLARILSVSRESYFLPVTRYKERQGVTISEEIFQVLWERQLLYSSAP